MSWLDLEQLAALRRSGAIRTGMLPKATCIGTALEGGVARAHVLPAQIPDSLLLEIFTPEGIGTLVVADLAVLSTAERHRREHG